MRSFHLALSLGLLFTISACTKGEIEDTAVDEIDADGDGFVEGLDCDDDDALVNDDAEEICDGIDNNCDGVTDDDATDRSTWYADTDGDGYGDADNATQSCDLPDGYTTDATDCDDASETSFPGADEVCGGGDENCDGETDEDSAVDAATWYADEDEDGLGDEATSAQACLQPDGYVANMDDCFDSSDLVLACCSTDAPDGDLVLSEDLTLEGGVYWFGSVEIPADFTLSVSGEHPLVIYANSVEIAGVLDLSGAVGLDSSSTSLPDGGAAGAGGGGGGGGGDCGNGTGAGGAPNGLAAEGEDSAGGHGGLPYALVGVNQAEGGDFDWGTGGGGGGSASAGLDGEVAFSGYEADGGYGGEAFGTDDLEAGLYGGAGGAGGGANGGGGGGGGGALAIYANQVDVSGLINVSGGDGGGKLDGSCGSGGGGGGGGGSIWLHADLVVVSGELNASGGAVAALDNSVNFDGTGGAGSDGRVRISAAAADVTGLITSGSLYEDVSYPECIWEADTVYDVQDGTLATGVPAVLREIIVTATTDIGFFAQEADGGAYGGVFVYTTADMDLGLAPGDRVSVWGETDEYYDLTQVAADYVLWHWAGDPVLGESVSTADLSADFESWESVLVTVPSVTVVDPDLGYGEFSLDDGVLVDDEIYSWDETFELSAGDTFTSVTGVLNYSYGTFKLEPRDEDDLQGWVPAP